MSARGIYTVSTQAFSAPPLKFDSVRAQLSQKLESSVIFSSTLKFALFRAKNRPQIPQNYAPHPVVDPHTF